jgi:hypothetical protein
MRWIIAVSEWEFRISWFTATRKSSWQFSVGSVVLQTATIYCKLVRGVSQAF